MKDNFKKEYARLNGAQKKAVDTIEGPVMVIAGPGTGKTQILTLRIANILASTDASPDTILALTFTESAAANIRRRLVNLIGSPGYYVAISTFHGFCNNLIREYPEEFPGIISSLAATEVEQIAIVRDILDAKTPRHLKPFGNPYYFVTEIISAIRSLKNEGYDPIVFKNALEKSRKKFENTPDLYHKKGPHKGKMKGDYQRHLHDIEKNEELSTIYESYKNELGSRKLYDFEDMILETVQALENRENFLLQVQERYQYVLVDEHQDTNGAQNKVLERLSGFHENPNLFVVGDEKQAIFRFQGASLENFLYFKNKYPNAALINLEDNYRSTQSILDASQSVIDNNHATLKTPLVSRHVAPEKKIEVHAFEAASDELMFAAGAVEKLIQEGNEPSEIAVVFRQNKDAYPVSRELERRRIPATLESDQNILDDPEIKKLLLLFETVAHFGNDEKLGQALHIDFLNIDPLEAYRIFEYASAKRVSVYRVISSEKNLEQAGLQDPGLITAFFGKLRQWKRHAHNESFLAFFERVVQESGFLRHILSLDASLIAVEKLNIFFGEAKKMAGNKRDYKILDFLDQLHILQEHRIMLRGSSRKMTGRVRLMTAHRAKGLEFDRVFIIGATDGHWGNRREMSKFHLPFETKVTPGEIERNEDERRLFYMALTRARREIFVSYSTRNFEGREQVPSQFIGEIGPEFKEEFAHSASSPIGAFVSVPGKEAAKNNVGTKEFLREVFLERGISPTALNNYLVCPWKYFYVNLIRIPKVQTRFQIFGVAAHYALQKFFTQKREFLYGDKTMGNPGVEFLISEFQRDLEKKPVNAKDFGMLIEKGTRVLRDYFSRYHAVWNYHTLTEYRITASVDREGGGQIKIVGNLDKLELQENGEEVVVVDYKVKQPESRNWIEGKTKARPGASGSRPGDYKRQLVFYKLLLDLHPLKKYAFKEAVIDFVEPSERGVFKREAFAISDEDTKGIQGLIGRVASEIYGLSFWDKRCENASCEFCDLRDMMKKNESPS
jgi:DNA helicase II / ATP-dependent DNA helicase PcrA